MGKRLQKRFKLRFLKISFWTLPLDESIDDMNFENMTIEMTAMATYFSCKITVW